MSKNIDTNSYVHMYIQQVNYIYITIIIYNPYIKLKRVFTVSTKLRERLGIKI